MTRSHDRFHIDMKLLTGPKTSPRPLPILLFDDECAVCRRIAAWVRRSAQSDNGEATLIVQGIGEDPEALRALHPDLDIWEAYATVHVVLPDGTLKRGGEAVAEVLRSVPRCSWFTWVFRVSLLGVRPAQRVLDLAYLILADARPLLGCESCGTPSPWVRPLMWIRKHVRHGRATDRPKASPPHFTSPAVGKVRSHPAP